ncbi:sodium-dependent transporter [Helicobacter sp. CaF467b]|uniref:sodium-dependent transporter n=1 Tax=Helicobacter TaxID=209 RepID=UPI001F583E94|nr:MULTISPECIES: sodium-dependent transporter [Helicobacter]MCI2235423.1 sodium-dependent transporter [Helicobacter sp. CaF467b]MCL9823143.1 sodium-dependent transporter [Helicobacter colisuis]
MTRFSKIGFILATAGSAIGLGGIWKFPYMVGESGGGAFVLIFIIAFLVFGLSVFIAEMILGRASERDCFSAFETLAPKGHKYLKYGGIMVFSGLVIFSFYVVVLGWLTHYMMLSLIGLPKTLEATQNLWGNFVSTQVGYQLLWHFVIVALCAYVLNQGVKKGIEKLNLILMPLLLIIFIGLLGYAIYQDSFWASFNFLFAPDFSKLTPKVIVDAIGQAFFALSLGVGVILTYSNSLPKKGNFIRSAIIIALLNFVFCIVAGLVIFTFIFGYGATPDSGPGLVFISLPLIFANMGLSGQIIAFLFFIALIFAGITSAISMLEPLNAWLIDRFSFSRTKANLTTISITYILGVILLFSNIAIYQENLSFFGKNLFGWFDYISASYMLPLAGVFLCIFVGWILPKSQVYAMCEGNLTGKIFKIWYFIIKFIAPVGIIVSMITLAIEGL